MRHNAFVQKCASPPGPSHDISDLLVAPVAHPAKLRRKKSRGTEALTTFRINTCKSVSKQRTLTSFRINTCEKPRGGGTPLTASGKVPFTDTSSRRNAAPRPCPFHFNRFRISSQEKPPEDGQLFVDHPRGAH